MAKRMTGRRLLNMSDEELETYRDPRAKPLGVYDLYVEGVLGWLEKTGKSLEQAAIHGWAHGREHKVFIVKAAQHIREEGLDNE